MSKIDLIQFLQGPKDPNSTLFTDQRKLAIKYFFQDSEKETKYNQTLVEGMKASDTLTKQVSILDTPPKTISLLDTPPSQQISILDTRKEYTNNNKEEQGVKIPNKMTESYTLMKQKQEVKKESQASQYNILNSSSNQQDANSSNKVINPFGKNAFKAPTKETQEASKMVLSTLFGTAIGTKQELKIIDRYEKLNTEVMQQVKEEVMVQRSIIENQALIQSVFVENQEQQKQEDKVVLGHLLQDQKPIDKQIETGDYQDLDYGPEEQIEQIQHQKNQYKITIFRGQQMQLQTIMEERKEQDSELESKHEQEQEQKYEELMNQNLNKNENRDIFQQKKIGSMRTPIFQKYLGQKKMDSMTHKELESKLLDFLLNRQTDSASYSKTSNKILESQPSNKEFEAVPSPKITVINNPSTIQNVITTRYYTKQINSLQLNPAIGITPANTTTSYVQKVKIKALKKFDKALLAIETYLRNIKKIYDRVDQFTSSHLYDQYLVDQLLEETLENTKSLFQGENDSRVQQSDICHKNPPTLSKRYKVIDIDGMEVLEECEDQQIEFEEVEVNKQQKCVNSAIEDMEEELERINRKDFLTLKNMCQLISQTSKNKANNQRS